MDKKDLHEANRISWNEATKAHNSHKGDQAAFFRDGGTTLFPEDIALLGDIQGQSVVHLQCNAGQDTLSIARLGADITGVDISDEAVTFAQQLSAESGVPATFIRSDLYDWFEQAHQQGQQFDVAYTSYGALVWLSDIQRWAQGVASVLKPGGRLIVIEFHPAAMIFDWDLKLNYDYGSGAINEEEDGVGDYVALSGDAFGDPTTGVQDFVNPHPAYDFAWGIGDILNALLGAKLQITHFHEYLYSNGWEPFGNMRVEPGRRKYLPEGVPTMPLMYSVIATKPE